jgi:16S rRNA (uracil1498-N3)-methyltransferase
MLTCLSAGAAAYAAHTWTAALEPRLALCSVRALPSDHGRPRRMAQRVKSAAIVCLNRLLLEPSEVQVEDGDRLVAHLPSSDPRTEHVRSKLKAKSGQRVRAGVLDAGVTNQAQLEWVEPGKEMRLDLGPAADLLKPVEDDERSRLDLLLAMPRPLQFARLLPMISSMGVGRIWLTGAARVERSYFSSHLLKAGNEAALRKALVQGLEQSGETAVPEFLVRKELKWLLSCDEFAQYTNSASSPVVKLACHPERLAADGGIDGADLAATPQLRIKRLDDIQIPEGARVLLAVGPERGWEEPEELELLASHGFQMVTLGPRTLRSDVAVISLLAVAQQRIDAQTRVRAETKE